MFQEVVCFFNLLESATVYFWARAQWASGQAELDKQMEVVPAHQPGTEMCWSKKWFSNHEEALVEIHGCFVLAQEVVAAR